MTTPLNGGGEVAVADISVVGYRVTPIPFTALTAGQLLTAQGGWLIGFAVEETSGANPARIQFIDGQDVSGVPLIPVQLAANESAREFLPMPYVPITSALYALVTAGSVSGTAFVGLNNG